MTSPIDPEAEELACRAPLQWEPAIQALGTRLAEQAARILELEADAEDLRAIITSDDGRLRAAEARVWKNGASWGCDAAEHMAELIEFLRERIVDLEAAQREILDRKT